MQQASECSLVAAFDVGCGKALAFRVTGQAYHGQFSSANGKKPKYSMCDAMRYDDASQKHNHPHRYNIEMTIVPLGHASGAQRHYVRFNYVCINAALQCTSLRAAASAPTFLALTSGATTYQRHYMHIGFCIVCGVPASMLDAAVWRKVMGRWLACELSKQQYKQRAEASSSKQTQRTPFTPKTQKKSRNSRLSLCPKFDDAKPAPQLHQFIDYNSCRFLGEAVLNLSLQKVTSNKRSCGVAASRLAQSVTAT
eukprot:6201094-Pleurochrysis_carterae.AAC.6